MLLYDIIWQTSFLKLSLVIISTIIKPEIAALKNKMVSLILHSVSRFVFFALDYSLRSKRFPSSYCAKVKAGVKNKKVVSFQLSRRPRAETLATQAST